MSVVAIEVLDDISLHVQSGQVVLGLLVFRLLWGVFGASTARFAQFVRGPATVLAYLRGQYSSSLGHNPLGALSVVALLASLGLQVLTGLAADDEIFTTGPLAKYVGSEWVSLANQVHEWNKFVLLALVVLHVSAIAWYAIVKKNNLVRPMITGSRATSPEASSTEPSVRRAPIWASWFAVAVAAAVAWGIFEL